MLSIVILFIFQLLWRTTPSAAFSWQLNAVPTQCSDISITVTGSGGQPPYSVLVVPFGASPFPNHVEVRGIIQKSFNGNSGSITLPINYPANSQFVAVVSDSSGFGTGGTGLPTSIGDSSDNSCFNASHTWAPHYWFFIGPLTQAAAEVVQCNTTRVWWNHTADVEGTPTFVGVIPGGTSFQIPQETITNTTDEGYGFSWVPQIREGTSIVIVSGDNRGLGAGGSALFTVAHSDVSSCVTAGSPGVTPGAVVPGAVKTPQKNMAHIIGGAVGGSLGFIALCALAAFLLLRRRPDHRSTMTSGITSSVYSGKPDSGLSYYKPEPFPYQGPPGIFGFDPHNTTSTGDDRFSTGTQQIEATSSLSRSGSGSMTLPSSPPIITTTIIQHSDGGPGRVPIENPPTTINLPPTYNSLAGTQQRQAGIRRAKSIEPNRGVAI